LKREYCIFIFSASNEPVPRLLLVVLLILPCLPSIAATVDPQSGDAGPRFDSLRLTHIRGARCPDGTGFPETGCGLCNLATLGKYKLSILAGRFMIFCLIESLSPDDHVARGGT
jgi:hypothetical protein